MGATTPGKGNKVPDLLEIRPYPQYRMALKSR